MFKKSPTSNETANNETKEPVVEQSLFVDNDAPVNQNDEDENSPLKEFLSKNYMLLGSHDGYLYPNAELLEANLKRMRSDFRLAIDRVIDSKRSAINELRHHQISTKGISERLENELELKIAELLNLIHELDTQKILSLEDEGLVSTAVHDYRIGFIKGIEQYRQEKLFAASTKLF